MNNIKLLRESILSALPLSMAKDYERMNKVLNTDKETLYYKTFKKLYDKTFGKDSKGKPIYRKYINVDNMPIDEEIYDFLKQNGYNITEEEFNAGIIIKNKDDKNNHLSLEELQKKGQVIRIGRILTKKKAPFSLILKWDKISKQISNKKLIVISRHPYDIAGQSTDRAWESCMTLETDNQECGDFAHYVDTGIKAGVLIAYLISNDDKNINKPLARVLIKPLINKDNNIYFIVSNIYGVAGNEFKKSVEKWVNKNLNKRLKSGVYKLSTEIYDDGESNTVLLKKQDLKLSNKELYEKYNSAIDRKNKILYYFKSTHLSTIKIYSDDYSIINVSGIYTLKNLKNNKKQDFAVDIKNKTIYSNKENNPIILLNNDYDILNFKYKRISAYINENNIVFWNDCYTDKNNIYITDNDIINLGNMYKIKHINRTNKFIATNDTIKNVVKYNYIPLKYIDVSNVVDMSNLFFMSKREDFSGIETWDTSNVENMKSMFAYSKFNGDISNWDVSNVKSMIFMFQHSNFDGDISNWDVSSVKYMEGMFKYCSFNQDISEWNTRNVIDMSYMFYKSTFNGDISNWNTRNVIDMRYMFYKSNFNGDISKWNVSNVKNMNNMFERSNFNQDISNWNVSNVVDMSNMFERSNFNQDISKWNVKNLMYKFNTFLNSPLEDNPPKWY